MIYAACKDRFEIVKLLLISGANVNGKDNVINLVDCYFTTHQVKRLFLSFLFIFLALLIVSLSVFFSLPTAIDYGG